MSRYYDGYDLTKATISIHYETSGGSHGATKPVNVTYNNEKIRFAWLVDAGATADVGQLKFEIHAYGSVSGNDGKSLGYVWKSKTNGNLNVLQSLCDCEEVINEIDDTWIQELVTDVATAGANEIAGVTVGEQVARAEDAAARAESAADNAERNIANALNGYATESYVQTEIANANIEGKLADYAKKSEVETLVGDIGESESVVGYVDTKVDTVSQKFGNLVDDENNPLTVEAYVNKKVDEVDVSEQLENYYKKDETYNKEEVDDKLKNLDDYATKTEVSNAIAPLSSSITTNTENISSLSTTIGELQADVSAIDTSPRLTYDVAYNDTEDEEV